MGKKKKNTRVKISVGALETQLDYEMWVWCSNCFNWCMILVPKKALARFCMKGKRCFVCEVLYPETKVLVNKRIKEVLEKNTLTMIANLILSQTYGE